MKIIRDTSTVPTEGWQYPGLNGYTIYTRNYSLLYDMVREHFQSNGAPVPSEQDVTDWMCDNLVIPCLDSELRVPIINRFTQGLPAIVKGCCNK